MDRTLIVNATILDGSGARRSPATCWWRGSASSRCSGAGEGDPLTDIMRLQRQDALLMIMKTAACTKRPRVVSLL